MKPVTYVPELDGIRAVSVWLVMLFHAGAPLMAGGWVGVDVFFILSGFLITTLLVGEEHRHGRVKLGQFWIRRILRLLPAYYLYLIPITVFLLSTVAWDHSHGGWNIPVFLLSLWAYFANFAPLGGIWEHQYLVSHLWSLAVEQQFYLLLCGLYLIARNIGLTLGVCLLFIFVAGSVVSHLELLPVQDHLSLFGRGSSLILGCLAAYYAPMVMAALSARMLTLLHIAASLGAIGMILATLWRSQFAGLHEFGTITPFSFALYLALALTVAGFWYRWSRFGAPLLTLPVLVWTGKISYGVYVYHMAAWGLTFRLMDETLDLTQWSQVNYALKLVVYFAITHGVAALSYRYVERPFLKLKDRLRSGAAA